MSSDNISSIITLIPLGTSFLHAPLISDELIRFLHQTFEHQKKTLILYNRRGSGRAWICQDCGYFPLCPHCDIALAYHTTPRKQMVCHHCNYTTTLIHECPSCHGFRFEPVGIGIQRIADDLSQLLGDKYRLLRIDSDAHIDKFDLPLHIRDADIIIGTHAHTSLVHADEIESVVFLLFESDLTFPDYRSEEELYHTLDYVKKSSKNILIQTHTPNHPLLTLCIEGNYRDFLRDMSKERSLYGYPPFAEFAVIRIKDPQKEKVQDILTKLVNKITQYKSDDIFLASDMDIWERHAGEWTQKIILKGPNLRTLLDTLEVEIVRNRGVTLEWR